MAGVLANRMPTAKASWIGQLAASGPAVPTDDSGFSGHHQSLARDTGDWKQQVRRSLDGRSNPRAAKR
jgi:hypothetical protein